MIETTKAVMIDGEMEATPLNQSQKHNFPTVWKSIGWLIVFFLLFFGAVILFGALYGGYLGVTDQSLISDPQAIEQAVLDAMTSPFGIASTFALQAVLLIPVILSASHFSHQPYHETLAFKPVALTVIGNWLLIYVGYLVLQTLVELVNPTEHNAFEESLAGSKHLGLAVGMILVAPVIEELIFRGYLFKAWRNTRLGLWGTLVVTSLLFTVLHIAQYSGMILLYVFVLSIILGLAREKTGSIWPPMIIHGVNNLIAVVSLVYLGIV